MIREFTVGCSKTINMGNYSSLRIEGSLTIVVSDGDDYALLKAKALQDLNQLLEDNYRAVRKGEQ